jgi:uncharacterized membrane protein
MQIIVYFMIYSIIGWAIDTTVRSVKAGKFTQNPVLGIPFSPIYGTGALFLILCEPWIPTELHLKFFLSGAMLTSLEWIMGEMSLLVLKKRYWDYTHHRFDLRGHTSPQLFLTWCLLGLFLLEVLHPWVVSMVG